jgi:hypothetical protein
MKTLKIRYVVHRCPHDDKGKQVIMYLDDGIGIVEDDELCKATVN